MRILVIKQNTQYTIYPDDELERKKENISIGIYSSSDKCFTVALFAVRLSLALVRIKSCVWMEPFSKGSQVERRQELCVLFLSWTFLAGVVLCFVRRG